MAETKRRTPYCWMIAWACGAGEESCSEGLKTKLMLAGVSMKAWIQKGKVDLRRNMLYQVYSLLR
jgi:hypothetical protein